MSPDLPLEYLPTPHAVDIKRAAALLMHVAGPQRDREGLLAVLAEADADGRTPELVLAVVRMTRQLSLATPQSEAVPALQEVALHAARLEALGLTGLEEQA